MQQPACRPPTRSCGRRNRFAPPVSVSAKAIRALMEPSVLDGIGAEFDNLGEFERHAIDVAGMDAEQAAATVASRLEGGDLAL